MSTIQAILKGIYDVYYREINENELMDYINTSNHNRSIEYLILDIPQEKVEPLLDYLNEYGDNLDYDKVLEEIDNNWNVLGEIAKNIGLPESYIKAYEYLAENGY